MFPMNSECLISISDAFSAFCLRVPVIFPRCSLYPQQKRAYSTLHPQAWAYIQVHAHRHLLSGVPWISEDHLFQIKQSALKELSNNEHCNKGKATTTTTTTTKTQQNNMGSRNSTAVKCWTHDQMVAGLSPSRERGQNFLLPGQNPNTWNVKKNT